MHTFIALGIVVSLNFGHSETLRLDRKRKHASKGGRNNLSTIQRTNATGYGCCIVGPEEQPHACQHFILDTECIPAPALKHLPQCPATCPDKLGYGEAWFDPFYADIDDRAFTELDGFKDVKKEYMKPLVVAMALGLPTQTLVNIIRQYARAKKNYASFDTKRVSDDIAQVQEDLKPIEARLQAKGWSWQGENGRNKYSQDGEWAANRRRFEGLVQALRRAEEDSERFYQSYRDSEKWLESQIEAVGLAAAQTWDSLPSLDPAVVQEKCAAAVQAVQA